MQIYPQPRNLTFSGEEWSFSKKMVLTLPERYTNKKQLALFREFFKNATAGTGKLQVILAQFEEPCAFFTTSNAPVSIDKRDDIADAEYKMIIKAGCAKLIFKDTAGLNHAFFTLLKVLEIRNADKGKERFTLPIGEIVDAPKLSFRGLHLCVFPETLFYKMRKMIRLAAFLGYSHIIMEFWGMYPYRSEKSLGRKKSFSRQQISTIVQEGRALGVEMVPMLNIYGHAAQNRVAHGKHTVLEQNPRMAPYFEMNGWNWNLLNPNVSKLQKQMIDELLELFYDCKYFHIGCDEAYDYGSDRQYLGNDKTQVLIDHINDISGYLQDKGRTTLMWGDMLLCDEKFAGCEQWGESKEICQRIIAGLDKRIILVDWQYTMQNEDLPTAKFLSEQGFKVICAPWENRTTAKIIIKNIEQHNYYGLLQTTWHTLFSNIDLLPVGAILSWCGNQNLSEYLRWGKMQTVSARYLRCVMRSKRYEEEGISLKDIR